MERAVRESTKVKTIGTNLNVQISKNIEKKIIKNNFKTIFNQKDLLLEALDTEVCCCYFCY